MKTKPMNQKKKPSATTTRELASALNKSQRAIQRHIQTGDAPKPQQDGSHDVSAWRKFLKTREQRQREASADPEMKRRKLLADVLYLEAKVERMRENLIAVSEVRERFDYHVHKTEQLMKYLLSEKLPPKLVGKSAVEIQKLTSDALYELVSRLRASDYLPDKKTAQKTRKK